MRYSKIIVADLFESLDQAHSAIAHVDLDGNWLRVNRTLRDLLSCSPDEKIERSLHDFMHGDDLGVYQGHADAFRSGDLGNLHIELRLTPVKDRDIWVGMTMLLFRDVHNAPESLLLFLEDISARKQTEAALHREISKNQLLFKTASDGLHVMDAKGKLLQASDSFCRLLGYTQEEMRGMSVHDWDASLPANCHFEEVIAEMGSEGIVRETQQRCKDGRIITLEISSSVVDVHGIRYVYASARDITPRKKAERLLREREASLRAILDNMPHMAWLKDLDGRYLAANRLLAQSAGFSHPDEMVGKTDMDVWPRELAEKYRADDIEVAVTRRQKLMEEPALDNGMRYWSETFKSPILDEDGDVLGTTGYALDITERKRMEEWMQLAASIYKHSSEAIVVTDECNLIVEVNPAFTAITGYTLGEVRGQNPKLLRSGKHDAEFYAQMWGAIMADDHWEGEIWDKRKNGEVYPKWINISVLHNIDGSVYRYVAQFSDITEKKKKEEMIWKQANFDMLTGLPNRRLFRDRLEHELKKSNRTGLSLALLFIDLDRFKEINDTLGHDVGDQLLVQAAQRIAACVRETDTVARLGGDEFTVILAESTDAKQVERIARDIIRELTAPFLLRNENCYITASIGITLYPNDAGTSDDLMKHADQAMYAAKDAGRNRFRYYTNAMQYAVDERLALTNDLRLALERDELEVWYQPIVSLGDGGIHKAEALLRWKHPERDMVGPAIFIPLAEESGLIFEIGEWVFRQSISCIAKMRDRLQRDIQISVNKSPMQFTETTAPHAWLDTLTRHGLQHDAIAVEITEGLLLRDTPAIRDHLDNLYDRGVQISLDDFGTGYSSLSYLKKFKVDYLKIDRSFVSNLDSDENDMALVEAIIVMAHKLGIKTIAEGVETKEQCDLLAHCGCDYAQGYWFSRAVPEDEFLELLASAES